MLGKMLDVTSTRSTMEAIGFYILSTVVMVGLSTTLVHVLGLVGVVGGVGSFFEGGSIHTMIGTGFVLVLSSLIVTGKKMTDDLFSILLVVLGVYLSYNVHIGLGLVPVALLTTLKKG